VEVYDEDPGSDDFLGRFSFISSNTDVTSSITVFLLLYHYICICLYASSGLHQVCIRLLLYVVLLFSGCTFDKC